ncbi:MAG: sulfate transporter CysZ [Gammaproteobacteria bacterium]|nr:sulfate transporter CysZ [Gammaproteobacteria bacterium]MDH5800185.1 sulfate transporter CysZ [Gammaproteobacteria bacterium]
MGNPVKGATYLFSGLGLIFKPGIRGYVVIPLSINVLLFAALVWFGVAQFSLLTDWVNAQIPEWLQWLSWLLWIVFAMGILLVVFFCFSLLANLVAAPFNSLLAQAVERTLDPNAATMEKTESGKSFVANFIPAIANELRKILYFLGWSIPFLILFWIPVIHFAAPVLWFLFTSWMLCLEYADYPMGNHDLLFDEQKQKLKGKRLTSYGFGAMVSVATMTPIANFLVMPAAVAGATLLWVKEFKA